MCEQCSMWAVLYVNVMSLHILYMCSQSKRCPYTFWNGLEMREAWWGVKGRARSLGAGSTGAGMICHGESASWAGQMDDSSKWESALWLADNWKLVSTRVGKNVYIKGNLKYGWLNFLRWLQQDVHFTCTYSNILHFYQQEVGCIFLPLNVGVCWLWLESFPKLGHKAYRLPTWDTMGLLALGTLPPCYEESQVACGISVCWLTASADTPTNSQHFRWPQAPSPPNCSHAIDWELASSICSIHER